MLQTNTHVFSDYLRLLHTHPSAYHNACIQQEMLTTLLYLGHASTILLMP
jgi:hypothetical protein